MADAETYVGQPIERKEDARLLTGNAVFADHYPVRPGALHAAVLRSPYAHAEILSIDASAALALPVPPEDLKAALSSSIGHMV